MGEKITRFAMLQLAVNNLSDDEPGHWESNFPSPSFISQVVGFSVSQGELLKFGRMRRPPPPVVAVKIPDAADVVEPGDLPAAIKAADLAVSEARLAVKIASDAFAASRRTMAKILGEWTTNGVTPASNAREYIKSELATRAAMA
jgi:hypothetical protein